MYKRKEYIFIFLIILIIIVGYFINRKGDEEVPVINSKKTIIVTLDGEIARRTRLEFQNQITYGTVFIRVKSLLNEYSDLQSFDLQQVIYDNTDIDIPTIDVKSNYEITNKIININNATKKELMTLPQIGEKRSETILDYIKANGKIKTWDEFFSIVSLKDEYKEEIKRKAIL